MTIHHKFKIKRHGHRKFRWYWIAPSGKVQASGPEPVRGETKYMQSAARCQAVIATLKNDGRNWIIELPGE